MSQKAIAEPAIAVLVPCHNEAVCVRQVVRAFRGALPRADVYVYDNNSTDGTAEIAAEAGAIVRFEPLPGKGNVVRRMFSDIEADVYVLVDGDDTYDAEIAPSLVARLVEDQLDMVNAARVTSIKDAYRPGHRLGNHVLTQIVGVIFGRRFVDMLSGYRVFSRRFVKSFPALASGFEIETELTVHALEMRMKVAEVPTLYSDRPEGSESKLRTFQDGLRILTTILELVKEERPLPLFASLFALLTILSLALGTPIIGEFMATGEVPRFPTAILAAGVMILAVLSLFTGLILDSVTHGRREMKRLVYLGIPALAKPAEPLAIRRRDLRAAGRSG